MPYDYYLESKAKYNKNKIYNPLFHEGDGYFDFISSAINFAKNNSDLIKNSTSAIGSTIKGVKDIVNTIDNHRKNEEEIKLLIKQGEQERELFQKILNRQKLLKEQKLLESQESPKPTFIKEEVIKPISSNISSNDSNKNTELSEETKNLVINIARNLKKKGEGIRIYWKIKLFLKIFY